MRLADIVDLICSKLGQNDPNTVSVAKKYVNMRYIQIYEMATWFDSQFYYSVTMPTTGNLILSPLIDRIMAVFNTASLYSLPNVQLGTLFRSQPALFNNVSSGQPIAYNEQPPIACSQLPQTAGVLTFVSSSTQDNGLPISLFGDLAGAEYIETVTCGGTTPVNSVNSYDTPYVIAKAPTWTGTLTVKDSNSNVINTVMPYETERKYPRITSISAPVQAQVYTILFKRKVDPLINDNDTPRLRNIDNALYSYGMADMLEFLRQFPTAAAKYQSEAEQFVQEAMEVEQSQQGNVAQIIPVPTGGWGVEDWGANPWWDKQYF